MGLTRAAVAAVLVAALCVVATGAVWATRSAEEGRSVAPAPVRTPVEVVHDWDEQRAAAWAEGDLDALRDLYLPRARVGRDDAAMLAAYLERGLRVEGLTTQLIRIDEVEVTDDELVLEVTDRVHAGTVRGPGFARSLPRDGVSVRRLTFRTHDGAWRVARAVEVRSGRPGAARPR